MLLLKKNKNKMYEINVLKEYGTSCWSSSSWDLEEKKQEYEAR